MKGNFAWNVSFDGIPLWKLALRLAWLSFQIILVVYLGRDGAKFFYQGF